jgi:hypothetical protein
MLDVVMGFQDRLSGKTGFIVCPAEAPVAISRPVRNDIEVMRISICGGSSMFPLNGRSWSDFFFVRVTSAQN